MSERYLGRVVSVQDKFTVVINRGSENGVALGQQYLIVGLGETISDPDTGEALEQLEIVRGRARVTHVQSKIATLRSIEQEQDPDTKEITKVVTKPTGILTSYHSGGQNTVTEIIRPGDVRPKQLVGVAPGDFVIRDSR